MPVQTNKNTNYGGTLVTQKYSPLENIQYSQDDRTVYSALLTNRWNLLRGVNILPRNLRLATANWQAVIASEAGKRSPLVVISSNRSNWIAEGIAAAENQLAVLRQAAFTNASDLKALTARAGQTQSPPLYCPTRTGNNRNVYIVVHIFEYMTYKKALANTGITVVGWMFDASNPPQAPGRLVGFGASRFAAIEFCKNLRAQATPQNGNAPWNYAWLLDDNVVALTNFAGYNAVENAMTVNHVCAGFHGGSKAESFATNRDWAVREVAAGRGAAAAALPDSETPGIVQQAALWNIGYLTANHLNFGPIYITSGEDVSFGSYFDTNEIPYFYYEGIGVRKEITDYDNGEGAQNVNKARQEYARWFAAAEASAPAAAAQPPPPPPPVRVLPSDDEDGGEQTLANFVVNRILPNSQLSEDAAKASVQNNAKCQGVEQITCGAIKRGFVTDNALTTTFKINGAQAQAVTRIKVV